MTYLLIAIFVYYKLGLDKSNPVNNEAAYIGKFFLIFLALLWIPNIIMSFSVRQELQPDPQIIFTLLFAPIFWLYVLINYFIQTWHDKLYIPRAKLAIANERFNHLSD